MTRSNSRRSHLDNGPIARVPDNDRRAVQKAFLKPEEVTEFLSWTLEEVQSFIAKGVLSTVRIGNLTRIHRPCMESLRSP